MDTARNIPSEHSGMLKNYSEVDSFNRLLDPDIEISSELTAGGDSSYITQDINDHSDLGESVEKGD